MICTCAHTPPPLSFFLSPRKLYMLGMCVSVTPALKMQRQEGCVSLGPSRATQQEPGAWMEGGMKEGGKRERERFRCTKTLHALDKQKSLDWESPFVLSLTDSQPFQNLAAEKTNTYYLTVSVGREFGRRLGCSCTRGLS